MSVAFVNEDDILDESPIFAADDPIFALLDELDAREAQTQDEQLAALGASCFARDLSDADPHWVQHVCVSDDSGVCPHCTAYVAAGGVL